MARVTFEGKRYSLLEGETVLQALLRGGASVPFSCRKGTCQSCLLRAEEGDPGASARAGLRAAIAGDGYFLPCQSRPTGDLRVARPDPARLTVRAHVRDKEPLAPGIVRLRLDPETNFAWRAGQFVNVRRPDGASRSYSLASVPGEDDFLELHVKRIGETSAWLVDEVTSGDVLDIQGPLGECCYEPQNAARPMLLVGTGTGLSPLIGIAREALLQGHRGAIHLYHGARDATQLYLRGALASLQAAHPNFRYGPCVSGGGAAPDGVTRGRALDVALARHGSLVGWVVYLCGLPAMVHDARHAAFRAGARRGDIHADPFEPATPFVPDDTAKLSDLLPDPELWEALDRGPKLRAILTDFYGRVYRDPRLEPFFHRVTIERAIDKQYAFLADVFSGSRGYFGLKPFNAHHWMVISDELFDYRERIIEDCMRRHGLAEHLIHRWCSIHELFRREIVKSAPRGLIVDGVERMLEGFSEEVLDIDAMCDGCQQEMPKGAVGRLHARTGELFCSRCSARKVGSTLAPPPGGSMRAPPGPACSVDASVAEALEAVPNCVAVGYVDVRRGALLARRTVHPLPPEALDLVGAATAALFQGEKVAALAQFGRGSAAAVGAPAFKEVFAFSESLLHVFLRANKSPDHALVVVCHATANIGMVLHKTRQTLDRFDGAT